MDHPPLSGAPLSERFGLAGRITAADGLAFLNIARQVGILGEHDALLSTLKKAARVAPLGMPVLLVGESGTGKELFAQFIHRLSGRNQKEWVALNCAAISPSLFESELFGHEKGAFTGADRQRIGAFEKASSGTLFLDEIGEMPMEQQAKLLRALQEGVIQRVGGDKEVRVRSRFIAATNIDPAGAIREKRFRKDLYFRFRCVIELPPLRHRMSDLPLLADRFLRRFLERCEQPVDSQRFSREALQRMQQRLWDGNIRELERVVEMSSLEAPGEIIDAIHLPEPEDLAGEESGTQIPDPHEGFNMEDFLGDVRNQLIQRALAKANGNRAAAARLLGCSRQNLAKFCATAVDDGQAKLPASSSW